MHFILWKYAVQHYNYLSYYIVLNPVELKVRDLKHVDHIMYFWNHYNNSWKMIVYDLWIMSYYFL